MSTSGATNNLKEVRNENELLISRFFFSFYLQYRYSKLINSFYFISIIQIEKRAIFFVTFHYWNIFLSGKMPYPGSNICDYILVERKCFCYHKGPSTFKGPPDHWPGCGWRCRGQAKWIKEFKAAKFYAQINLINGSVEFWKPRFRTNLDIVQGLQVPVDKDICR